MSARRAIVTLVDLAAMAAAGLALWFAWNPLMDYLPRPFATDICVAIGWIVAVEPTSNTWLDWLGEIEWLAGALAFVLLLLVLERLVATVRRHLVDESRA